MKDQDKMRNTKAAPTLVILSLGWTASAVVLPSEDGAFCQPTEMCGPPPTTVWDEQVPEHAPAPMFGAVASSSVSSVNLSSGSISLSSGRY
jgi:hypothetical protein